MKRFFWLCAVFSIGFIATTAHADEPNTFANSTTCACPEPATANAGKPLLHYTQVFPAVQNSCFPMAFTTGGAIIALGVAYALDRKNESKEPWNKVGLTSKGFGAGGLALIFQTWTHLTNCVTAVFFTPDTVTAVAR